ncbi:DUF4352 domain-containing protein [Listeria booriae]|uniref:DUF4352 domain-containing protein n=1 Tax=Listeria booriae TaxID=1552123 RepID=A0A7X1CKS2_9LIST|nr:DUF4352 domain-containing protein [Listeria booriae]MBC1792491.1 DUF4352 domain-containing protein [Listeria booriae]MBC1801968.1 DUF4352 domain-containing protein [Listeria booriae]MBC1804379.1 DUF4352 domain-containing protein [Listeria booriae]MBC1813868.1 DUF4352 domain-containing protein [Listeria booriae]
MKKSIAIALSACTLVAGLAACGNTADTTDKSSDTAVHQTQTKNEVGKVVETPNLDIQVKSVKSGYAESKDKNKQMLIVEIAAKNTSKIESGAGAADFRVKADNGKTYEVYGLESKNFGDAIATGKTLVGKGYYEIPKGTKTVTFYYAPAGEKKGEWSLTVPAK